MSRVGRRNNNVPTAHDQDPMLPVSGEEYLRARIHELDPDSKFRVTTFDPAARLRDQLAAMTPRERASQAWAEESN